MAWAVQWLALAVVVCAEAPHGPARSNASSWTLLAALLCPVAALRCLPSAWRSVARLELGLLCAMAAVHSGGAPGEVQTLLSAAPIIASLSSCAAARPRGSRRLALLAILLVAKPLATAPRLSDALALAAATLWAPACDERVPRGRVRSVLLLNGSLATLCVLAPLTPIVELEPSLVRHVAWLAASWLGYHAIAAALALSGGAMLASLGIASAHAVQSLFLLRSLNLISAMGALAMVVALSLHSLFPECTESRSSR